MDGLAKNMEHGTFNTTLIQYSLTPPTHYDILGFFTGVDDMRFFHIYYTNAGQYYPSELAWFMFISGVLGGILLGASIMALVSF